jgi:D-sedoheptulose 7-phosphate isomerase
LKNGIKDSIKKSTNNINEITKIVPEIEESIIKIIECFKNGKKVLLFGNGGSAADAQHIAAELIGRFSKQRQSYPAIALTTDASILTAVGNDFSFDEIFSRQCESIVSSGDVVIGISTSGNSINVKNGLEVAKKRGATTIGLLGSNGGILKSIVDIPIIVKSSLTPEIQEAHRVIYHLICKNIEDDIEKWK